MSARQALHARVRVYDASSMPWTDTSQPGVKLKSVRRDDGHGHFLGLVGFEPFSRSGLHQHQGVATSFVATGSLTDYQGPVLPGQVGINLAGATHDAFAYEPCLLVTRLEGPVLYLDAVDTAQAFHAGSRQERFVNPAPDVPPDINVDPLALSPSRTAIDGLRRHVVFDYAATGSDHRMSLLALRPQAALPAWRTRELTELWIRGGNLVIDTPAGRVEAHGNCFVVIDPGTEVRFSSPYGAQCFAWADGRGEWTEGAAAPELFGFDG